MPSPIMSNPYFCTMADGTLVVQRIVVDDGCSVRQTPTPELARSLVERNGVAVLAVREGTEAEVPRDRVFRGAWKDTGRVDVDMPKARTIWRDHLRRDRAEVMTTLDTAYLRADEAGDQAEKRRIAGEKQRLRDITNDPRIEAAQTPDELKAITL